MESGSRTHAVQPRAGETRVVADEVQLIDKEELSQLLMELAFLEWAVCAEE